MLLSVSRLGLSSLFAVGASVLLAGNLSAQPPTPRVPSDLIEVAEYLAQVDGQLACDPRTARLLAQRAITRLAEVLKKDEVASDTVAELRAQGNLSLVAADNRERELQAAERNARNAMNDGQLDAATALFRKVDPKACYADHTSARADIDKRRAEAAEIIAQGDREMAAGRAKDAAGTYRRAQRTNRDVPDLDQKIRTAEASIIRRELPWRWLYGHASFPMFLYSPPTEGGELSQTIYGRRANLSFSETTEPSFGRVEFGAAARLVSGFGVGFTYTDTERTVSYALSGTIPARTSTALRSVSNMIISNAETEKGYHVEIRGQFGGKGGEAALFVGPSFIDLKNRFTAVAVQELTTLGNGAFTLSAAPAIATERRIGVNFGADFSGFVGPVFGFGGGIRFVYSRSQDEPAIPNHRQLFFASFGLRLRL